MQGVHAERRNRNDLADLPAIPEGAVVDHVYLDQDREREYREKDRRNRERREARGEGRRSGRVAKAADGSVVVLMENERRRGRRRRDVGERRLSPGSSRSRSRSRSPFLNHTMVARGDGLAEFGHAHAPTLKAMLTPNPEYLRKQYHMQIDEHGNGLGDFRQSKDYLQDQDELGGMSDDDGIVTQKLSYRRIPRLRVADKHKASAGLKRCMFWPNCPRGSSCIFVHPCKLCEYWPNCAFGDKCIYIHPKVHVPNDYLIPTTPVKQYAKGAAKGGFGYKAFKGGVKKGGKGKGKGKGYGADVGVITSYQNLTWVAKEAEAKYPFLQDKIQNNFPKHLVWKAGDGTWT
tara:strand:- start:414 stop:1451 length:1038 start_codon:yes stop_codon:yes gene_type:complete